MALAGKASGQPLSDVVVSAPNLNLMDGWLGLEEVVCFLSYNATIYK